MGNFFSWLKRFIIRWTIYLVGTFVILAIIGVGVFFAAKPYLIGIAEKKLEAYDIKSSSMELSLPGKAVLNNVTLPAPNGMKATAKSLSARPPVGPFSGTATLYDLVIEYDNITLEIPYLDIAGIGMHDKDMSTDSKVLQNLARVSMSSLKVPTINVSVKLASGQTEKMTVSDFAIYNLKNGIIGSIGVNGLNGSLPLNEILHKPELDMHVNASSNNVSVNDIDIAYAYALFSGRPTGNKKDAYIFGRVNLDNIAVDVKEKDKQDMSLKLGHLASNGLKMRTPNQPLEDFLKNIQAAKKADNNKQEEKDLKQFIMVLVHSITAVNGEMSNVSVQSEKANVSLSEFKLEPKGWDNNFAIPPQMNLSLKNLSFDNSNISGHLKELLDMFGFSNQSISGEMRYSYNQQDQTLSIEDMSFNIGGLATGSIQAKVIHVDDGLFSADADKTVQATSKLGITDINMNYSDTGLIDHTFEAVSKSVQPTDVAGMKKELYDDLETVLVRSPESLLRDPQQVKAVSETFRNFARNPKQLNISIKAKDANGLTLSDLANTTGSDDQDGLALLLDKINLIVKSN